MRFLVVALCLGVWTVCGADLGVTNDVPTIGMKREAEGVQIDFRGTLQWSAGVTGPWTDLTNAASPYWPAGEPPQFIDKSATAESARFRSVSQSSLVATPDGFYRTRGPVSILGAREVVEFKLTGPFQRHFELAFAGMPDGIFPPVREKPYFDGAVQFGAVERPVSLRVRGNSSLQECPFPKMKFKVSREDRAGTPFYDAREIDIGTHCAEGGRGPIGRLRDERATYREALAYEAMELLGFTGPRVRRARITYHDTTPLSTNGSEVGWVVVRNAVILEDVEVMAERGGGRALDDAEIGAIMNANFDEQTLLDLRLFHVLLGNWDFALSQEGRDLWNTEVTELASGELEPVAGDFDLSSWVTETVQLEAAWDYHPEMPDMERQARWKVEEIRNGAGPASFEVGKNRFLQKRTPMETLVSGAIVDEAGRTNIQRHVTAFYDALALAGTR